MLFVVVSRYHGGAYVVFSQALNPRLEAAALRGSYASVIGGGPAAAVVFTREVRARASAHPRVRALQEELRRSPGAEARGRLEAALREVTLAVQAEVAGRVRRRPHRGAGPRRRARSARSSSPRRCDPSWCARCGASYTSPPPGSFMKRNRKQSFRSFGRAARGTRPVRAEVQDPEEIAAMRAAGHLAGLILDEVAGFVRAGVTTGAIDRLVDEITRDHGAVSAPARLRPAAVSRATAARR